MPEVGEHTPITDEEAEEWVRRMETSAEDLGMIYEDEDWDMFVEAKFGLERGYGPYDTQREVLGRGRTYLQQELAGAGFEVQYPIVARPAEAHIRDLTTGRFTSWEEVQKAIVPFRPFQKEKMMSGYLDTKVVCVRCGWKGTYRDCPYGHDSYCCPQCESDTIAEVPGLMWKLESPVYDEKTDEVYKPQPAFNCLSATSASSMSACSRETLSSASFAALA